MKKINLLIVLVLLTIIPSVFAAVTLNIPVAYGNYTSSLTLNCTSTYNATDNSYNVTFYRSASTGGGTTTKIATVTNSTASQKEFTYSYSITSVTDSATYNFTCYADNESDQAYSGNTGNTVTLDNTSPSCSISRQHPQIPYKGIQDIIWSSSDTGGLISTAVTIDRPQTGSDMSYTDVSRTLTLLSTDTPYIGEWNATILATDRVAKTCVASVTFKSYLPDGEIDEGYEQGTSQTAKLLVVLGIIGFIIWLVTKK